MYICSQEDRSQDLKDKPHPPYHPDCIKTWAVTRDESRHNPVCIYPGCNTSLAHLLPKKGLFRRAADFFRDRPEEAISTLMGGSVALITKNSDSLPLSVTGGLVAVIIAASIIIVETVGEIPPERLSPGILMAKTAITSLAMRAGSLGRIEIKEIGAIGAGIIGAGAMMAIGAAERLEAGGGIEGRVLRFKEFGAIVAGAIGFSALACGAGAVSAVSLTAFSALGSMLVLARN
jgi:hypothetical protein